MAQGKDGRHRGSADHIRTVSPESLARLREEESQKRLDVVLKCDTYGSVEAVTAAIGKIRAPSVQVRIIYSGVGDVSKSDLLMALTASKLVVGFNVGVMAKGEQWVKEHGGEARLYKVIFRLVEDLTQIARSLAPIKEAEERISARGIIVALFKSSQRGIIIGCEVQEGALAVGKQFRIISAMGPIYSGKIESLQADRKSIREARAGQRVGIKIDDFNKARIGDLLECYETVRTGRITPWRPGGVILRFEQES